MTLQQALYDAILDGDSPAAERLVLEALAAGNPAEALLKEALIAAMKDVGALFEAGEYYVAEMLVSAHAMKTALKHLRPLLAEAAVEPIGTVVIGTVKGDLHDIGKNLVGMMLEGAGFRVVDVGVDVPVKRFVQAAEDEQADFVALSALLTTTMVHMPAVIAGLKEAGLRERVKVLIGGAPITQAFADHIGADGFAPDAAAAANLARQLLGSQNVAPAAA